MEKLERNRKVIIKLLYALVALMTVILCELLMSGVQVRAEETTYTSGDYKYVVTGDETVRITGYTGKETELKIPSELGGKKVAEIGRLAFSDCTNLKNVVIPQSMMIIGTNAFSYCNSLQNVIIPDSVICIKEGAFWNCTGLNSITIGMGVDSIEENAFFGCSSLKNVTIPATVTNIGCGVFSGCDSLQTISVDVNNSNYISENGVLLNKEKTLLYAYPAGKNGTYTIPNGVKIIKDKAFYGCKKLTGIEIPNSVTTIEENAFSDCIGLVNVTIPNGVTHIGDYAFYNCNNFTKVTLPDSVVSIGYNVFYNCGEEFTIMVNKDTYAEKYAKENNFVYTYIGSEIGNKDNKNGNSQKNNQTVIRKGTTKTISKMNYKVTSVSKATVTCIGTTNKKTKSLTIPATIKIDKKTYKVTAIADNAFKGNKKIKKVIIGKNIITIGKNAFNGCKNLQTIEVQSKKVKKVGKNAFKGIMKNPTLKTDKKYRNRYMKMFQGK